MIIEEVYSPIQDTFIKKDINNSPIWTKAHKKEELTDELLNSYKKVYCYRIKFDGLKPIQILNITQTK